MAWPILAAMAASIASSQLQQRGGANAWLQQTSQEMEDPNYEPSGPNVGMGAGQSGMLSSALQAGATAGAMQAIGSALSDAEEATASNVERGSMGTWRQLEAQPYATAPSVAEVGQAASIADFTRQLQQWNVPTQQIYEAIKPYQPEGTTYQSFMSENIMPIVQQYTNPAQQGFWETFGNHLIGQAFTSLLKKYMFNPRGNLGTTTGGSQGGTSK